MNFYKYMACVRQTHQDTYYGPFISADAAIDWARDAHPESGCEAILLRPHLWTKCPSTSHDLLFMPIKGVVVRHGETNLIEVGTTAVTPSPQELRRLAQRREDNCYAGKSSWRRRK